MAEIDKQLQINMQMKNKNQQKKNEREKNEREKDRLGNGMES